MSTIFFDNSPSVPYQRAVQLIGNEYKLSVKGVASHNPDEFAINIIEGGNILMHMNTRWGEGRILFNTEGPDGWGAEENAPLTISPGSAFDIEVLHKHGIFSVSVNGAPLMEFKGRIHATGLNREIQVVKVENNDVQLHQVSLLDFSAGGGAPALIDDNYPGVPYQKHFNLRSDEYRVVVIGEATSNPSEFAIEVCEHDNVLIHMNPRWDEGRIVLNASGAGGWGEEQNAEMVIPAGSKFTAEIMYKEDAFWISVNGNPLAQFGKRIQTSGLGREVKIRKIERNDVVLHQVQVLEPPPSYGMMPSAPHTQNFGGWTIQP